MTIGIETERVEPAAEGRAPARGWLTPFRRLARIVTLNAASSLTRRIVLLNVAALAVLVGGILYLNQFREGLIGARVQSLTTQGEAIAAAIATSATVDETGVLTIDPQLLLQLEAQQSLAPFAQPIAGVDFEIDPRSAQPLVDRLVPEGTRGRVYALGGRLVADSLLLGGGIFRQPLPPPGDEPNVLERIADRIAGWFGRSDLPAYRELGLASGTGYEEVAAALAGEVSTMTRIGAEGELIVSVAVPVQRARSVIGALLLQTQGNDIDRIVSAERRAILNVFLIAAAVTIVLSLVLASTIAAPLRRLADAADKVRPGIRGRPQIPDYSRRRDEVGHLSAAIRGMTDALFTRIEAIERFAADVSHELKNPLTSLRSAVETLPLARSEESKARLMSIIQHDVKRLDRLISDISDASRLDAELGRKVAEPVDVADLLRTLITVARETTKGRPVRFDLDIAGDAGAFRVLGSDVRLSQVFTNLIDNARSFSPEGGTVRISLRRTGRIVEVVVDDDGPGIKAERIERIFERFYTDRPDHDSFGQHSGLGLSISRQIVEGHDGTITAGNRTATANGAEPKVMGARFTVRLPAAKS